MGTKPKRPKTVKPTKAPIGRHPWTLKTEAELRERPGVMFISLMTDEVGAQFLARGELPQYLIDQAREALDWHATLERRVCVIDEKRRG